MKVSRPYTASLINKICVTTGDVSKERIEAFNEVIHGLTYLEHAVIVHYANSGSLKTVAKYLELPVNYCRKQFNKAIRHLRAPKNYYRLLLGDVGYQDWLLNPIGSWSVETCGFSTKVTNTLIRNGFQTIEQLEDFVGDVPARFSYIDGLGKIGISELTYYYYLNSTERN